MEIKSIAQKVSIVLLLAITIFALIPNKKESQQFYEMKQSVQRTNETEDEWDIEVFQKAFKKAVTDAGISVSNCFVSGWIPYEMEFHVLTNNNEYIRYYVDVSKTDYLSPNTKPVYYLDTEGNSLWLDLEEMLKQ